jgi:protein-S-isoprenylcysteine O-methyltransferase Ste14
MHAPPARAPRVAWAGGALFVLSLGVFLYSYFVTFGRADRLNGVAWPLGIDIALFTAFALHHSALARSGAKRWLTRHLPPAFERTAYVWAASLIFLVVCLGWQPVPGVLYRHTGLAALAHWLVVLAGAWLTARAAGVLDPLDLAGIRQAAGQGSQPEFRVVGPYVWVRHPIYLGWILVVFGVPHMTATRFVFAVVSTLYLIVAIPFEERSLGEAFGDEYRNYQRKVRWRLVPGLW